jgi:hypothetical protein
MTELFARAPAEVIEYFDRRETKVSWGWRELAVHQHAVAFTVARTAGFDVIDDLRAAVRQAVVDRVPFEQFQAGLVPTLQAKGWWGKQVVPAPGGEKELVQLGSTRRLQTIYWANTASAHAAGEWARTQAAKDVLPYLLYKRSLSERRRREHEGWVGICLPVDDAWWRTHYPPNGWHCKCRVEQVGEGTFERTPAGQRRAPPLNPRLWLDKRTGRSWRVPEGIDPGWQRNPGVTREVVAAAELRRAVRQAARPDAATADRVAAARQITAALRRTPEARAILGNQPDWPYPWPADADEAARAWWRLRAPVAALPEALADVLAVPAGAVVEVTGHDAPKMRRKHQIQIEDYDLLQALLDKPRAVAPSGGKWQVVRAIKGRRLIGILKVTSEGEVFLNSFRARLSDRQWASVIAADVTNGADEDMG